MNVDPRGVKRGACTSPNCDCTAYERVADVSSCDYCSCAPAKHLKKDNTDDIPPDVQPGTYSLKDSSLVFSDLEFDDSNHNPTDRELKVTSQDDSDTPAEIVPFKILASVPNHSLPEKKSTRPSPDLREPISCSSNSCNDENTPPLDVSRIRKKLSKTLKGNIEILAQRREKIASCFPAMWPDRVEALLKSSVINDQALSHMIRILVDRLVENDLAQKEDFDIAAEIAYQKYAVLRTNVSTDCKYLSAMMCKRKYNSTWRGKKEARKITEAEGPCVALDPLQIKDPPTLQEVQEGMRREMAEAKPSMKNLKQFLKQCRQARVPDSKTSSAIKHLKEFPALKYPELLMWEFQEVFKVDPKIMKLRWIQASMKLMKFFSQPAVDDENLRTIHLLQLIATHFYKKNKEAVKSILEIYAENTPVQNTIPGEDEPPRLVGIGSIDKKDLQFIIYVDEKPIHSVTAVDGLIFSFVAYWIFNISFPSRTKLIFIFIAAVLFEAQYFNDFQDKRSVVKLIEEANIFKLPKK
ncbi:hypothetical protein QAD02_019310 [Eretmocerus hayati]|uniref:Uncharacterized protein n=1 Tax=Eretmocerus hayati TaxID=131215 RepID=A0ACC2PKD6_9HYME|nr:hypothetical protein QAD02_019310 [Eretmocerus hayati]